MKIVLASHFVKSGENIYSPLVDNLEIILKDKKLEYLVIQHTLNNDFKSKYFFSNNINEKKLIKLVFHKISIIRYITEMFGTFFLLLSLGYKKEKVLFIGIDPLNAIAGYFFKLLNKNTYLIYYIPDYSPTRFADKLLNKIYHSVEGFITKKADSIFCVSEEIYKLKNNRENVNLFKNYPPKVLVDSIILNNVSKNKKDLFIIGLLEDYYLMDEILKSLKNILEMEKDVKLYIIGGGTKLQDFKDKAKYYNLEDNVTFTGYLDKKDALNYIKNLGVSLAIYSNNQSYNKYGDSVKIRESIALGLPMITTNNHSTSLDLLKNNLGVLIDSSDKDISGSIVEAYMNIIKNYDYYEQNCLKFYNIDYKNEIIFDNILKHEIK